MARVPVLLLLMIVGCATGLRQRRQANGCGGMGSINIDKDLTQLGEGVIIPCCNGHDVCYDTCGRTKEECDTEFRSCLNNACDNLPGKDDGWFGAYRRFLCHVDALVLHRFVKAGGFLFYGPAQKAHNCEYSV